MAKNIEAPRAYARGIFGLASGAKTSPTRFAEATARRERNIARNPADLRHGAIPRRRVKVAPNNKNPEEFYADILRLLGRNRIPILIGGTYALNLHTGMNRETKDLDIFCKTTDYPKILKTALKAGYNIRVIDERWLAKIHNKTHYIDIIFSSGPALFPIDDTWFKGARSTKLFEINVRLIPPEEFIWSKALRFEKDHYDGADIHHVILKKGNHFDWNRLLNRMEAFSEILFSHLLLFRFVYPSKRDIIPRWVLQKLISRMRQQFFIPTPEDKVCRGPLLSRSEYQIDVSKWGFLDVTQIKLPKWKKEKFVLQ